MPVTRDDAKRFLVSLLPPGTTSWLDVESSTSGIGALFYAHGGGWKTYGLDLVETLRSELSPPTMIQKIPDWEAALGLAETPIAKYGTTLQRRQAVIAWLRQTGSFSRSDIRAVVQPYFIYANPGDIEIVEVDQSLLRAQLTYTNSTVLPILPDSIGSSSVTVLDDPFVAPAGLTLYITITATIEQVQISLLGPDGTIAIWRAGSLGTGVVAAQQYTLHTPDHAGKPIRGKWELVITTGPGAFTLHTWSICVMGQGVNYDVNGARIGWGLSAAVHEFSVVADTTKLGTGYDVEGARKAVLRIKPAHVLANVTIRSGVMGAGRTAIPDDIPSATPDRGIPA